MTAPGKALAHLVRPGDHLRPQAYDQHDRRCARVTECLVRQLDAIGGDPARRARSGILHGRSLACGEPAIMRQYRVTVAFGRESGWQPRSPFMTRWRPDGSGGAG